MADAHEYEAALGVLAEIETVKTALAKSLEQLCAGRVHRLILRKADYQHAQDCLREIVADLFYEASSDAKLLRDAWEQRRITD